MTLNPGTTRIYSFAKAKHLLPILAATAITGGVSAGFGFRVMAAPVEVTYNNTIYNLETSTCFAQGTQSNFCNGAIDFRSSSWWGNAQLAKDLSEATKDLLGLNNPATGTNLGANFAWQTEDPLTTANPTNIPFDGFEWDPVLSNSYARGGFWNSVTGDGSTRIYWLAKETAPPKPATSAGPILASNNGTNINTTKSLTSKQLLPQFEGGTLVVSPGGAISDNFTLNNSLNNSIDAAGNSPTFSGVFSDKSGIQGNIGFTNSAGSPGAITTLSGNSSYSGRTSIWDNATVDIGVANALPTSTELVLYGSGKFRLRDYNQAVASLGGNGYIELGSGNLTLSYNSQFLSNSGADISGTGGLIKDGIFTQRLSGALSYAGPTIVKGGTLILNGTSTSNTTVQAGATLGGTGTITGNVNNRGTVSPGNSIGTLNIIGNYTQAASGTLALEVGANGSGDLLQIKNGRVTDLAGQVLISSASGTAITPGVVYTGITTNPGVTYSGASTAIATFGPIAGNAGFTFVREDDPAFTQLNNGTAKVDATKLQFGWIQLKPTTPTPTPTPTPDNTVSTTTTPGPETIATVKPTGGSLTQTISASTTTLQQQCTANTGHSAFCQTALTVGGSSGSSGSNRNNISAAKVVDAGISSVYAAVAQGSTGGTPIPTASGTPSGYTSNQALAGAVTPDFVTVYGALFSIPTRAQLNQALHSITAEPYASMQSVALEAMEQFRTNALALSNSDKAIRLLTDADICQTSDGSLIPVTSDQAPSDCKPRKVSQASRWSLLIDATNTQANLDGTNELASLDYNIFQSTYGLQYDASKQWSIGAAFGYGQANLYNYEYANSSIDSDTYSAGAWAIYRPSTPWKITALVGYMNLQYDSSRNINFGGINRTATANWSGDGFTTALEVEYDWILSANKSDRNAIRLKPNTYLAYSLHSQGDITESGADSLNLAIDGHTADSLVYGIGFTLETPIQLASRTRLIPRLSVGYEHDFNGNTNEEHQLSASFAEVPALGSLDVFGQNRGADDLNVALNLELEISDQFSLYAGVGGSFWSNGNELSYGGGLRWRFGGAPQAALAQSQPLTPAPSGNALTPMPQP